MQIKKIGMCTALVLIVVISGMAVYTSDDSDAAATYTKDGLTYTLVDKGDESLNTAQITAIAKNQLPSELTIPKSITDDDGTTYHVTAINVKFPTYSNSGMNVTFEDNPGLVLPKNMFANSYLKSVKFGEGIEIPSGVLNGCSKLESVELPSTLTTIPDSAFGGCSKLSKITIGDNVKTIGASAFSNCKALSEIDLPDVLESIGKDAFKNCSAIETLNIGPNVSSIGAGAFTGTKITSVYISAKLTEIEIGESCFLDDLNYISMPEENPAFTVENGILYTKDKSTLLYYPRGLTTEDGTFTTSANIGPYAFYKTTLSKIIVTDGAATVGKSAFSNSSTLQEVILPNTVTDIGDSAFEGSSVLSKVSLPEKLDSIGTKAFGGSGVIEISIPEGPTSIGENMFLNCSSLTKVTIPKSVTTIESQAFMGCSALESVTINGDVTSIGNLAFNSCKALVTLNLPDSVTTIGDRAFTYCEKLVITSLPSKLESVARGAFNGCLNLKIDTLPDSLSSIGPNAFLDTGIESIRVGEKSAVSFEIIPSNITYGSGDFHAFGGSALKSVYLNNVTVSDDRYSGTLVKWSDNLQTYDIGPDFKLWKWENGVGINEEKKAAYLLQPGNTKLVIPTSVEILYGTGFKQTDITEISYEGDSSRTITLNSGSKINTEGMFYMCKKLVKASLPNINFDSTYANSNKYTFHMCSALKEMEIQGIAKLGGLGSISLEKFILHSCETITSLPSATYMELPSNLKSITQTDRLQGTSGNNLLAGSGTITKADEISKIAGKILVWNGNLKANNPYYLSPVSSDQIVICLDYEGSKLYIAVEQGTVPNLDKFVSARYNVSKWYLDPEKSIEYADTPISESITLYADVTVKTFTVTVKTSEENSYQLYCDDKEIQNGDSVPYGSTVKIVAPMKEGYDAFVNGSTLSATGYSKSVTGDLTFNLAYSQLKFTLKFNAVGADSISDIVGMSGAEYDKPIDPVRTGYKFVGWAPALPEHIPTEKLNYNTIYTYTAIWAPEDVSIYFDTTGGESVSAITRAYHTMYGTLPVPIREGYTFDGWYLAVGDEVAVKYADVVQTAEKVTLYAKWTIQQHTITFDSDGGSAVAAITQDYGTAVTVTGTPTKEGYTFLGWDKTVPVTMPGEDITLKALWGSSGQYSIYFDSDGGSLVSTIVMSFGETVTAPTAPTKTGYTFQYWAKDGVKYDLTTMPAENITLKAVWKANEYTITFDTDGGSDVASITQDYNTTVSVAAPTKTGYTFQYWAKDGVKYDLTTMPAENITLKAVWKANEYTITFDTDGGSDVASITQDYNTTVSVAAPTKTGYTFQYWAKDGVKYDLATMPAENITLKAVWKVNSYEYTVKYQDAKGNKIAEDTTGSALYDTDVTVERIPITGYTVFTPLSTIHITADPSMNVITYVYTINTYTISFNTDGGTVVAAITQEYNSPVSAPVSPTKTGYTFGKWLKYGWEYTFTTMPAENITLTAYWYINQYTISFDSDGGSAVDEIKKDYNASVTAPVPPTKAGYTFQHWAKDGVEYNFASMPAENITLKAVWKINQYTITFDSDGGSAVASITQDYNTDITAPAAPTMTGYTFQYWEKDGSKYALTTMPAENITLKAVWKANEYTITFDSDGGSAVASITQDYNTTVSVTAPTKAGYTFQYWEKDGAKYDLTTMPAENITLKAVWKINQYTITFDSDGGSAVASITQDYNTDITAPAAPTMTGYTFQYWEKDGSKYALTTMPAENITLKAVWLINAKESDNGTASIEFGSEGGSFVVPATVTETVTVSMGGNTSVKVESGSDLAGKVVVSEVKTITNPASAAVSGTAYEFVLTADGSQYNGKMLVTLPYTGESGKEAAVYYWNGSEAEKMKVVEYTENSVTFETSHNSTYVVASEKIEESTNGLLIIVAVAIVLAAIVFGSAYYFRVVRPRNA